MKMRSEKKENYGKYIKEMYWPKASEKKKFELEKAISNIKHTSPVQGRLKSPVNKNSDEYQRPWRFASSFKRSSVANAEDGRMSANLKQDMPQIKEVASVKSLKGSKKLDFEDSQSLSRPKKQRNPTAAQSLSVNPDYLTQSRQKRDLDKGNDPVNRKKGEIDELINNP